MKKIKYLLIILGMASFLSVQAQGIAQMPTSNFRSTSTMVGSGSTLPTAAHTGVRVTGATVGTYADASYASRSSRPRRVGENEGTVGEDEYTYIADLGLPIGDALIPLMLFACAYFIWRRRMVRSKMSEGCK
ncbi:MAG: hypothetical protein IKQ50_06455 [Paludibacteraceae bacterium]|nr:hypothetical protein [Paludibacteraceae bacterium]MBR6168053.1 hypothetical protein [Paludibacteraceae bacterium]